MTSKIIRCCYLERISHWPSANCFSFPVKASSDPPRSFPNHAGVLKSVRSATLAGLLTFSPHGLHGPLMYSVFSLFVAFFHSFEVGNTVLFLFLFWGIKNPSRCLKKSPLLAMRQLASHPYSHLGEFIWLLVTPSSTWRSLAWIPAPSGRNNG